MNSLSLDNHLNTTNPADDTLHTPHIFPHITNDNGLNLYKDDQLNTPVRSDTSKCLTSEDNIPSLEDNRYYTSKSDNGKKIKRSQLKLVRQNSVDIVDESSNMINEVTNNNIDDKIVVKQGLKSRRTNNLKEIRIPVISISDASKNDTDGQNVDKLIKNEDSEKSSLLTVPDVDKNLKNLVNNNFNKLISQKSIDMELANFQREAAQKMHDMHSISIEDIPSMEEMGGESCIKNTSILIDKNLDNMAGNRSIIDNESSTIIPNLLNSNIVYNDKGKNSFNEDMSKHGFMIEDKNMMNHMDSLANNKTPNHVRQSVIFQKDSNLTQNQGKIDNDGYELLLKWPGGKKVYLKEVYRDEDEEKSVSNIKSLKSMPDSISIMNDDSDAISSASVKRKLQDTIQANKKMIPSNFKVPIKQINKPQNNSVLKDCIILPQMFTANKLVTPHIIANPVSGLPVGLIPTTDSLICTNLNIKDEVKTTSKSVKNKNLNDDKSYDRNVDSNDKDKQKKACIQVRNRAAVNRYRYERISLSLTHMWDETKEWDRRYD